MYLLADLFLEYVLFLKKVDNQVVTRKMRAQWIHECKHVVKYDVLNVLCPLIPRLDTMFCPS